LFKQSEDFSNAYWSKSNAIITANSTTAPDGTTTADTLAGFNTSISFIGVAAAADRPTTYGVPYVLSVFAKANTETWLWLEIFDGAGGKIAYFDLSGGVVGTTGAGVTASITSVGNGWYRCSVLITPTSNCVPNIGVADGDNDRTLSGNDSIYIWGAQLEQRSSVTAYTATTTARITNYIPALQTAASGVARFEHNPVTGESLGLEIEEQRTNVALNSEDFSTWTATSGSVVTNQLVAPDGTLTADVVSSTGAGLFKSFSGITAIAHTASIFVKYLSGSANTFIFGFDTNPSNGRTTFNIQIGTIVSNGANVTSSSITPVGNGWYRLTVTATATSTSCIFITYNTNSGSQWAQWGMQIEAGSFATSYIPTVASQVTRSADSASMTGTNFSSWYRADEGTIYSECSKIATASGFVYDITDGTTGNEIKQTWGSTNIRFFEITTNSSAQSSLSFSASYTNGNFVKGVQAYKVNDIAGSADGATAATDTSAIIPVVNQMQIGYRIGNTVYLNGTIKKIAYYPKRLTNAELQGVTTV
jgi:hypothetical protein